MKSLSSKEIKELLFKCWMTHDGMWFFHCLNECGIEKTNKINKASSRSLGMIEIKRFKKAFGIEEIKNFEELKLFFEKVVEVVKADFMKFTYNFPSHNVLQFEMHQCFAYDGVKRIGVIDSYVCGIYDRIEGWFDGLEIKYSVSPQIKGCLINEQKPCLRTFNFYFNK